MALAVAGSGAAQDPPAAPKRANELTLAGLRPGKDKLRDAEKRFGSRNRVPMEDPDPLAVWYDSCLRIMLTVDVGPENIVQSVTVQEVEFGMICCLGYRVSRAPLREERLPTGLGLTLGDAKERIFELYGPPQSSGPGTLETRETEFFYYAFDWAGSDVPQVLEVTCDRETGRVIKIMLAFPSL